MSSGNSNYHSQIKMLSYSIVAHLGGLYFGYELGVLNLLYVELNDQMDTWDWSDLYYSCASASLPLGALIGSLFVGKILMNLRKSSALVLTDVISLFGLMISIIEYWPVFLVSRFICGIGVGLNSALVPIYSFEWTPNNLQGLVGNFMGLTIPAGISLSFLISRPTYFGTGSQNYWMFIVTFFPAICCMLRSVTITVFFRDEAPIYYVQNKDYDSARRVLQQLYIPEAVEVELNALIEENEENSKNFVSPAELFRPRYQRRMIIGILFFVFYQCTGINAVGFYSSTIFGRITGGDLDRTFILSVMSGLIQIFATLILGLYVIDKFGRKVLLQVGNIFMIISLGFLTTMIFIDNHDDQDREYINLICNLSIFIYLFGFSIGWGPIIWIYVGEILPPTAMGFVSLSNWTAFIFVVFMFPIVKGKENENIAWCFGFFTVVCILGVPFIWALQETKDKQQTEIEESFVKQEISLHDVQDDD